MVRDTNANPAHVNTYDIRKLKQLKITEGLQQQLINLPPLWVTHCDIQIAKDIVRVRSEITITKAESNDLADIKEMLTGEKDPSEAQPAKPATEPDHGGHDFIIDGAEAQTKRGSYAG